MSSEGHDKLNVQICDEAAQWLVEFRTGDIDPTGRQRFDEWVRTSPEHLRAFIEMTALWEEAGQVDARRHFDVETLISQVQAEGNVVPLERRFQEQDEALASSTRGRRTRARWAAAAAVAGLMGVGSLIGLRLLGQPTYTTDVGEQRSLRLADGSTVTLNSRSRVRVEFTDSQRTVELLEGQALFRVAKSEGRPFIVRADGTAVQAIGTQFDVNRRRDGTIVTVIEGRVAVVAVAHNERPHSEVANHPDSPAGASEASRAGAPGAGAVGKVLLSAGEQVEIDAGAGTASSQPKRANVSSATAWTQGQLVLESASLTTVADEFNRYSSRKLVAIDHGVSPLHLSGVFVTDPDFLIHYLRSRPDIEVRETDTEILIIRNGPG